MEIPRLWRLQKWNYGLRVEVDEAGRVVNEVPTTVRHHVETNIDESHLISEEVQFVQALSLITMKEDCCN